jgi:cell division protein FtsB
MGFRLDNSGEGRPAKLRAFPNPEDKLRAMVDRAPEAEEFAERWMDRTRPFWNTVYAARRRVATGGVILLTGWLFLHVMFGANGMVVYKTKRAEYQKLQGDLERLQKENDQYEHQIKALQTDPKTIEREAREQLHYTRPGEVIYVDPATPSQPKQDKSSAKK